MMTTQIKLILIIICFFSLDIFTGFKNYHILNYNKE